MNTIQTLLPLLTSALLMASLVLAIAHRWLSKPTYRFILIVAAFGLSLIQINDLSIAHYLAGLFGNLSITSVVLLGSYLVYRCTGNTVHPTITSDLLRINLIIAITALIFYPSALGAINQDLYAEGYYPVVLGPIMFAVFTLAIVRNWYYLAAIIGVVFAAYGLGVLESDNLWDYLMDPLLSIYCLIRLPAAVSALRHRVTGPAIEAAAIVLVGTVLLFSVFLSRMNHDAFLYQFVVEDGFLESVTSLSLFCVMLICCNRILKLRQVRSFVFLFMTGFIALVGLFGAGEEISWGQRIVGWETTGFFLEHNKQRETGLHNLVVEIDGERLNLNKIIFGTGLAIAMSIYLFIMTPLYRSHRKRQGPFSKFIDRMAIPMPRNYHVIGYIVVVACVELLVDSSKRGEITEFAGSIVFLLNVAFPYNREIFDIDIERPHA
jgi:hypothetical protein